jgi:DEAD/DEAH box helicase domain-containing protein
MHPPGPGEHVLDVETLHLFRDLRRGGPRRLRISCAVLHDVAQGKDHAFACEPVPGALPMEALYHFLEACRSEGCTLVGHNLRAFDWPVLAGEFEARGLLPDARRWGPGAARLVDTLAALHARLGWRPSLQCLAEHNLGEGKSMDGALAPALWRQGRKEEVLAYCARDVHLTLRVWRRGRIEGQVAVGRSPSGAPLLVAAPW